MKRNRHNTTTLTDVPTKRFYNDARNTTASPDYTAANNSINKQQLQQQHRHNRNNNLNSRFITMLTLLLGGIAGYFHGRYVAVNNNHNDNISPAIWFDTTSMIKHPITVNNNTNRMESAIRSKQQRATTTTSTSHDGWHTIQVFHGDTRRQLTSSIKRKRIWYSQSKQDFFVLKLFRHKKNGYFIDLASNDAIAVSNTLALEIKAQWTGLCIEPNPLYWFSLAYYQRCQVVATVVGKTRMDPIDFAYDGGVRGGIIGEDFDNKSPHSSLIHQKSAISKLQFTVPLQEVFERHNVPKVIDYMSLDVEGAEEFVMEHFPFSNYKFSVLTVERPSSGLQTLLNKTGYVLLRSLSLWGETLWAHESIMSELDLTIL